MFKKKNKFGDILSVICDTRAKVEIWAIFGSYFMIYVLYLVIFGPVLEIHGP